MMEVVAYVRSTRQNGKRAHRVRLLRNKYKACLIIITTTTRLQRSATTLILYQNSRKSLAKKCTVAPTVAISHARQDRDIVSITPYVTVQNPAALYCVPVTTAVFFLAKLGRPSVFTRLRIIARCLRPVREATLQFVGEEDTYPSNWTEACRGIPRQRQVEDLAFESLQRTSCLVFCAAGRSG